MQILKSMDNFKTNSHAFNVTPEMIDKFRNRTKMHINYVINAAKKLEKNFPEMFKGLSYQSKKHDFSKFILPEYLPYVLINWKHNCNNKNKPYDFSEFEKEQMDIASLHHITNNKHHPQYWVKDKSILKKEDKKPKVINASDMDMISLGEMISDWDAMGIELKTDSVKWAEDVIDKKFYFGDEKNNIILDKLHFLKN